MSTSSPSIDRVFAHALQTVRKIPRTGSSRPPPEARLKLYGLYKQSMEGDVTHVMPRPPDPVPPDVDIAPDENLRAEIEKWDAWYAQRGIPKTEAKRRYISTLIETMHKYASFTPEARELVSELEFVWDQIKTNTATSSDDPPSPPTQAPLTTSNLTASNLFNNASTSFVVPGSAYQTPRLNANPDSDDEDDAGPQGLGFISPAPYAASAASSSPDPPGPGNPAGGNKIWRSRVEKALSKMTTEVAALREQLESRREERRKAKSRRVWVWFLWGCWAVARHLVLEAVIWGVVLFWMRRRGDRRAEEALRVVGRFLRNGLREMGFRGRRGIQR
ncbi:acyl CoA binding protein-domain-containing protein [Pyronema domesticum]|nr:acyl CoA binding protein-domain-containing protein [Pyronema domesticum]